MKYLKLFEEYSDPIEDIILMVQDITAYIPGEVGGCDQKWVLPNFDTEKILSNKQYSKYRGRDKKSYIRYYVVGFTGLSNLYRAYSDIKHRSNVEGLKYFIINRNQKDQHCNIVFFSKEDYEKLYLEKVSKNIRVVNSLGNPNHGWDVLFDEDLTIDKSEFDIIYEDDDIMAVKPKSYRAAIKYSADMPWKSALKKCLDWIEKYITKGSYYGGYKWYKQKAVTKEVKNWWQKIFNLPGKQKEVQTKEFIEDFPRYLLYIVYFKHLPSEDPYSRLQLLFDISRSEYGQEIGGRFDMYSYWGEKLDAIHNQLKIANAEGKRVTLRNIHNAHGQLFNRAFRNIVDDMTSIKDNMYDLLGFWSDKGGEYTKDALVFITNSHNRLSITKPEFIKKNDKGDITWQSLGYYDDPEFDWWELDKETQSEKEIPKHGYKDLFASISGNVQKLMNALDEKDDFKGFKI